jgi:metal transporter CNNM
MILFFGLVLLLISALFAGLTIGLMSLDIATLRRKGKQGDKNALKVLRIREDSMLLLVTLLLGNAAANSFFSILVGDHLSGAIAGILSTVLIFIFGEVSPQAFLSRYALSFGAASAPFIRFLMRMCYPICAPIAYALTVVLGEEAAQVYTKKDILSIVEETDLSTGELDTDEQRLVRGALSFSHKKVQDIMTPNTVVTTIEADDILDEEYLEKLKQIGYSRIPVHTEDPNYISGILYFKDLVGVSLPVPIREVMDSTVHFVNGNTSLNSVLNQFIKSKIHLFIVIDDFGGFEGVVTLEDIIEEIIGAEIMDEGDVVPDMRMVALEKKEMMKRMSRKS